MEGNIKFGTEVGESKEVLVFPPKFTDFCGAQALVQATGCTATVSYWMYTLAHVQTILHSVAKVVFPKCKICCHLSPTHLYLSCHHCS